MRPLSSMMCVETCRQDCLRLGIIGDHVQMTIFFPGKVLKTFKLGSLNLDE